jgi:hypothetical protein
MKGDYTEIRANSNVVTCFDRSKKLIKYPRVALGTNASPYSGLGGGSTVSGYTIKASGEYNSGLIASKAFTGTNDANDLDAWLSSPTAYSSNTPVANSATLAKFGQQGSWLEIKLPNKIKLSSTKIFSRRTHITERNDTADIWASNTGTDGDWVKLTTIKFNDNYTDTDPMVAEINTYAYYQYFAIQITRINWSSTYANIGEWELFGTPEYDPEAHGTDVTVKSVPNVPNTDWLEVYYDGQDYSTMPATVDNKTGVSAYDATANGGVGFDPTYKAFTFNGTDNQYLSASTPMSGNYVHSFSLWVKPNSLTAGSGDVLFFVGAQGNNTKIELFMESDRINYLFGNNSYNAYPTIENGKWYHLGLTYNGVAGQNGREIYLNNVKLKGTHSVNSAVLALSNSNLEIGRYPPDSTYDFDGSIANFRIFNRVLTSDEIYQLYAYQKEYFGHSTNNMTLKAGRLGIGTSEPRAMLDVRGDVAITPYGYVELNQGSRPGDSSSSRGMRWSNTDNSNYWSLYNSNNDHFRFSYNGAARGWVDPNDSNAQMNGNFTGQHRTFIKDVPFSQVGELEGLIVSSDQNKYIKMSGGIEAGSNAITTNESLPVVSLSNVVTDKKCFGVISASEDPENRTEQYGAFGTNFEKEKGDTRVYINSIGEGAIWVVNTNGSLESGDYITTSNVTGYGQKQDGAGLMNYTVAKITMDCDFEPVTQHVQVIKKDEEGENILDEHGQIQWEDHPTETEKAYKIRYLDASGVETDEANAVHIAAFVGCTYHCG